MEHLIRCRTRGCNDRASGLWELSDDTFVPLCAQCGFKRAVLLVQSFNSSVKEKPAVDPSTLPRKPDVRKLEAVRMVKRASGETVKTFIYAGET